MIKDSFLKISILIAAILFDVFILQAVIFGIILSFSYSIVIIYRLITKRTIFSKAGIFYFIFLLTFPLSFIAGSINDRIITSEVKNLALNIKQNSIDEYTQDLLKGKVIKINNYSLRYVSDKNDYRVIVFDKFNYKRQIFDINGEVMNKDYVN